LLWTAISNKSFVICVRFGVLVHVEWKERIVEFVGSIYDGNSDNIVSSVNFTLGLPILNSSENILLGVVAIDRYS